MKARLVVLVTAASLFARTPASAQNVPTDCSAPTASNAVRLALLITDLDGTPFSGIGHVTVFGQRLARPRREAVRPSALEHWYCSAALPRGSYTVEVQAHTFDCVAISLSEADTGLVVRLIRLRPDPWLPPKLGRYGYVPAADPHLALVGQLSTRRCGVSAG
ncbi:MAG: hypothetical protein ACREMW_07185 [Gemmatimonadales bacterium]